MKFPGRELLEKSDRGCSEWGYPEGGCPDRGCLEQGSQDQNVPRPHSLLSSIKSMKLYSPRPRYGPKLVLLEFVLVGLLQFKNKHAI